MQEFFQGVKETDRENEVYRILGAFKLNPFEQLNLKFDASVDDVKKAYRKASLLVHPDKCKHPKAQDAFEMLGQAQQALNNEDKMRELRYVLTLAQGMIRIVQNLHTCQLLKPLHHLPVMLYTHTGICTCMYGAQHSQALAVQYNPSNTTLNQQEIRMSVEAKPIASLLSCAICKCLRNACCRCSCIFNM